MVVMMVIKVMKVRLPYLQASAPDLKVREKVLAINNALARSADA